MSGREFSKVSPALWRSARFAGLSDKGKVAFLYFCTNAHVTSVGCYMLPDGYACSDLGWPLEIYIAARTEVADAGMIEFEGGYVLIDRWFRHNPPMNKDHAKGTMRFISEIECDRLREKAEAAFVEADALRVEREERKAAEKAERATRKQIEGLQQPSGTDRLLNTAYFRQRST